MSFFKKKQVPNENQQNIIDKINVEIEIILGELKNFTSKDITNYIKKIEKIEKTSNHIGLDYSDLDNICVQCQDELTTIYLIRAKCDHLMTYTGTLRVANFWDLAEHFAIRIDEIRKYIENSILLPTLLPFLPRSMNDKSGVEGMFYCYYVLDEKIKFIEQVNGIYKELDKEVKNIKLLA